MNLRHEFEITGKSVDLVSHVYLVNSVGSAARDRVVLLASCAASLALGLVQST